MTSDKVCRFSLVVKRTNGLIELPISCTIPRDTKKEKHSNAICEVPAAMCSQDPLANAVSSITSTPAYMVVFHMLDCFWRLRIAL